MGGDTVGGKALRRHDYQVIDLAILNDIVGFF